ncbi:MAG: DHH family phosphoesterase [Methanosphaera sp.]|nr:DHH family phosphoesterase [Methanosphaera sp.]
MSSETNSDYMDSHSSNSDYTDSRTNMQLLFNKARNKILDSDDITIYTHTDCDGITAGGLLSSLLEQYEIEHSVSCVDINEVQELETDTKLTIFSDLGAGQDISNITNKSKDNSVIILDHHPPIRPLGHDTKVELIEINPNYYGLDGSYTVSGGGLSYLLSKSFGSCEYSWMGILSAVGDMQNTGTGRLRGLNTEILDDAINSGQVSCDTDLLLYGRNTRPLFVALSYFGDIHLPLTNNRNECIYFLENLGIPVKDEYGRVRCLCDLNIDEKSILYSELLKMMVREVPDKYIKYLPKLLSGQFYEFNFEPEYSSYRDASEYSTVINACGRNNRHDLGLEVIKGNRESIAPQLEGLVKDHKRYIAQNLSKVNEENNIVIRDNIQYFDGGEIKPSVIGTITGMLLNNYDWQKPMIGYTHIDGEEPGYKVSLRCSKLLGFEGIHFGNIVRDISLKCEGSGGGHSVACGAYIPEDNIDKFMDILDNSFKIT